MSFVCDGRVDADLVEAVCAPHRAARRRAARRRAARCRTSRARDARPHRERRPQTCSAMPSATTATPCSRPKARRLTIEPTIVSTTEASVARSGKLFGHHGERRARRLCTSRAPASRICGPCRRRCTSARSCARPPSGSRRCRRRPHARFRSRTSARCRAAADRCRSSWGRSRRRSAAACARRSAAP